MSNCWLISDMHFGHANIIKFTRDDGTWLRPFSSVEEMDEHMIDNWNRVVNAKDRVYMLGDVVINRRALSIMDRLNGDKVLIRGNHDIFKLEDYTKYFRDVRGYHVMNGMILSHIPLHDSVLYRFGVNIHGHTHAYRVMKDDVPDVRYHCVCVEQTDFAPMLFEDVMKRITDEGGHIGFKNGNN